MNARVSCEMPPWEVELLRRSNGARSIRRILKGARVEVPPDVLMQHLYVLYQLSVINLLPAREST